MIAAGFLHGWQHIYGEWSVASGKRAWPSKDTRTIAAHIPDGYRSVSVLPADYAAGLVAKANDEERGLGFVFSPVQNGAAV